MNGTSLPQDLISVYEAEKRAEVADSTLHAWIQERRIRDYGRGGTGKRTTVLVSLAEVQEAAEWRANSLSLSEAGRLLGRDRDKVAELCEEGLLPYRRFGRTYEIERAAVERMAAERAGIQAGYISFRAAERLTGVPWWALKKLAKRRRLRVLRGDRGAFLVDRERLAAVLESLIAKPDRCPACRKPTLPGRKWHRECAGPVMARRYWKAGPRRRRLLIEQASQRSRAWWNSPDGQRQRDRLSAERSGGAEAECFICGRKVRRKLSQVKKRDEQGRRTFCSSCHLPFVGALAHARTVVATARSALEAFERAFAIGAELEGEIVWQRRPGRRRPIALDVAIEALHAEGYSDGEVRRAINRALDRDRELGNAPRVRGLKGSHVNERYVTLRRHEGRIRRRKAA